MKNIDWITGGLIALAVQFVIIYLKYVVLPATKKSSLNQRYEEFLHSEYYTAPGKKLIIRIFHMNDEYEAVQNIPTHKVVDAGYIGEQFKFVMYES